MINDHLNKNKNILTNNATNTNVILAIKPKYVERILSGEKRYEFRKRIWKKKVDRVFIYATSPVKRIVASFTPGEIVEGTPDELWNKFGNESGITREEFIEYFKNNTSSYAIEINEIKEFIEPLDPQKTIDNFNPPVDFSYFLNEGIPSRRNQYVNIPLELSCEKIEGGYRIKIQSPKDDFSKCPVIKEKGIPFSEHPILRPYDKFFIKGSPDIGKVINIFIFFDGIKLPALMCSIVITKKRILILPAWGIANAKTYGKKHSKKISPVAHITIEKDSKGEYNIHYTGENAKKGKKKKLLKKSKLKFKNEHGIHIGTLGINDVEYLDPLGIVYRDIKKRDLPRKNIDEVNKIIQSSLSGLNPLIKLPPDFSWDNDHHLEVSFAMVRKGLKNGGYPIDAITPQDPIVIEQLNIIELEDGRNILITFRMGKGKLNHSFVWKSRS